MNKEKMITEIPRTKENAFLFEPNNFKEEFEEEEKQKELEKESK